MYTVMDTFDLCVDQEILIMTKKSLLKLAQLVYQEAVKYLIETTGMDGGLQFCQEHWGYDSRFLDSMFALRVYRPIQSPFLYASIYLSLSSYFHPPLTFFFSPTLLVHFIPYLLLLASTRQALCGTSAVFCTLHFTMNSLDNLL